MEGPIKKQMKKKKGVCGRSNHKCHIYIHVNGQAKIF
jgi:hypothetical protein